MNKKKEITFALFIFLAAFLLRFCYIKFLQTHYPFFDYPSSDVAYYQKWAQEIAQGEWLGREVFYGMPLFAYFLTVLKILTQSHDFAIRIIPILLGSLNCVLLYHLAKRLFSQKVAILSSILAAVNFIFIFYDWLMMPVTLIIFLGLVIVLVLSSLNQESSWRRWLGAGFLIGTVTLADGKFLFFFVLILIYLGYSYRKVLLKEWSRIFLPLAAGFLIVLSLVTFRNWLVGNDLVLLSAHSGINFYVGNSPRATGLFQNPTFLRPSHEGHEQDPRIIAELTLGKKLKPSEVSAFWTQKALSFIKNSPGEYARLLKTKFLLFFTQTEDADDIDLVLQKNWREAFDVNAFRIICPLAILGMAVTLRGHPQAIPLILLILSQLIFTLVFFLANRHRATIMPFLIIYEAFAVFWIIEQVQKQRWIPVATSGILCFALFMFLRPISTDQKAIDFVRLTKTGYVLSQAGEYTRAREEYQKALRLQPLDVDTLYNLGNCYGNEGNFLESIRQYQKALAVNPYDTDVLFNLARMHERANAPAPAIEMYQKLLSVQPNEYNAHLRLADIYRGQGNCTQAVIHYAQAAKINPSLAPEVKRAIEECAK